jgi:Ca2+-binding RTX toxin-like protein
MDASGKLAAGLCTALVLLIPANASAARIEANRGLLIYTASAGEANRVSVSLRMDKDLGDATTTIVDPGAQSITNASPSICSVSGSTVTCRRADPFWAELGDRDDTIVFDPSYVPDSTVYAGDGSDRITANSGASEIHGDGGNDTASGGVCNDFGTYPRCFESFQGGPGDDVGTAGQGRMGMYGDEGDDRLEAGSEGSDFVGGPGADTYVGGAGLDVADYFDHVTGVHADADGQVGDDGGPGEGDTISPEVELIQGGEGSDYLDSSGGNYSTNLHPESLFGRGGDDTIYGTRGWDEIDGGGGGDTIYGLGGPDTIDGEQWGETKGGDDKLFGGPGGDTLYARYGNNVLDGGSDQDDLVAGEGDDRLTGGPGADSIDAGGGQDEVFAMDGFVDSIDCSDSSLEIVHLDPDDWVHQGCDRIDYGGRAGIPPRNEVRPDLYGEPEVDSDQPLSFNWGTWSGTPYFWDEFRWQRCDSHAEGCVDLDTAGQSSVYTPTPADVGHTLRVRLTQFNKAGSGVAYTCPSGVVAERGDSPGPAPPCEAAAPPGDGPPSGPTGPGGPGGNDNAGSGPGPGVGDPGPGVGDPDPDAAPTAPELRLIQRLTVPTLRSLARRGLSMRVWCSTACRFQVRLRVAGWLASRLGVNRLIAAGGGMAAPARAVPTRVALLPRTARRLRGARSATVTVETEAFDMDGALRRRVTRRLRVAR